MSQMQQGLIPIRSYTHKELAKYYGCNPRTLTRWLQNIKDLGPRAGNFYTPRQVQIILENLGAMGQIDVP